MEAHALSRTGGDGRWFPLRRIVKAEKGDGREILPRSTG